MLSFRLFAHCLLVNIPLISFAQEPKRENIALLHKITATWCTPCGTWGWTLGEDLKEKTSGKALYLGLYASSSQAKRNREFYNQTASALAHAMGFSGYPSFGVNGIGQEELVSTSDLRIDRVKTQILKTADSFALVDPLASAAGFFSLHGDQLKVSARLRFWQTTEGQFYLAAYIVEDKAMNLQSGRSLTGDEVAHHDVLRTSMSAESAWGELIASGRLLETASHAKDFFFKIADTSWNKENLKVYLVIWKKEHGKFNFINASLAENHTEVTDIVVFPNPAKETLQVALIGGPGQAVRLSLFNISGKQVLGPVNWSLVQGSNQRTIDVSGLRAGMYILRMVTERGYSKSLKVMLY